MRMQMRLSQFADRSVLTLGGSISWGKSEQTLMLHLEDEMTSNSLGKKKKIKQLW